MERGYPMRRRKSLMRQLLDDRAKARKTRERERKLAEAAAATKRRERERKQAKAERERARAQAAAERQRTAAAAKAARSAKAEATERVRADAAAARDAKQAALEAKLAEAAQRTASLEADMAALERLLTGRARPSPIVPATAETRFNSEGVQAMVDAILDELQASVYPPGLSAAVAADYRPELRELIVELELPRQTMAPSVAAYRYVRARDAIEPVPRKDADVKSIYARLLARIVLRTLAEAVAASPALIVTRVSINSYVSAKNRATGRVSDRA